MNHGRIGIALLALTACTTQAQDYAIGWHTIDCGGGTSTGGGYTLAGSIGQHDAGGPRAGADYTLTAGFWALEPDTCTADFNGDGDVNTLDVLAFLNAWTAGDPRADINADGSINTLDVLAFLNAWTTGCA